MNIKKIILAFAASAMLAGGCTSLDMDPVSDITDLNYWKTPEQFDSFVFGLHSRFRSHSWNMFLLGEARSDVFGGIPFGGEATQGMERFPYNTLNAENPGISGFGDLYQNINQMNLFISRTLHTDVLTESARNYYLGQVYGLRAYYMYQLYRSWGDVVFTEEPSLGFEVGKLAKAATPAAEIFEQVKKDIESSLSYFGSDYTIKEKKSLWSKAATLMLKADVYLWSAHRDGGEGDARTAKNALVDIQNVALLKLYHAGFPGISDTLKTYFGKSPYAVVRYNCMTLLEKINDRNFREVLKQATTDPYEFIRRIAIHRMGQVGSKEFLPYIIESYVNDYFSERVVFNVQMALGLYRWEDVRMAMEDVLTRSSVLDKERVRKNLERVLKGERQYVAIRDMLNPEVSEKEKLMEIRYLKNANYHPGIPVYLSLVKDVDTSPVIRKALLESLAWFTLSDQKADIIEACKEILQGTDKNTDIYQEAERTYNRLTQQIKNK